MKLADYLETVGETHEAFAARIGVSQVTITRYINGRRLPRPHVLTRIVSATKGAVTANDFLFAAETRVSAQPEALAS